MNYLDAATILERFAAGQGSRWEWDDFLATNISDDPYLVALQEQMALLGSQFPPTQVGHYCSSEGIQLIEDCIRQLRGKAK